MVTDLQTNIFPVWKLKFPSTRTEESWAVASCGVPTFYIYDRKKCFTGWVLVPGLTITFHGDVSSSLNWAHSIRICPPQTKIKRLKNSFTSLIQISWFIKNWTVTRIWHSEKGKKRSLVKKVLKYELSAIVKYNIYTYSFRLLYYSKAHILKPF